MKSNKKDKPKGNAKKLNLNRQTVKDLDTTDNQGKKVKGGMTKTQGNALC